MIGHVLLGVIQIVRSSKMGRGHWKKKNETEQYFMGGVLPYQTIR